MMNTQANHGLIQHDGRNVARANPVAHPGAAQNSESALVSLIFDEVNCESEGKRYILHTGCAPMLHRVGNGWSKLTSKIPVIS